MPAPPHHGVGPAGSVQHVIANPAEKKLAAPGAGEHVVAGAAIEGETDGAEGKAGGVDRVVAGAAVTTSWSPLSALKIATGAESAVDTDNAGIREDRNNLVARRAVDRDAVHRAVTSAGVAGKIDIDANPDKVGPVADR